ncbi:MAG TPA: hypothetical protein VK163_06670, partial [Opitutaceae bacterium]|nr:hypothetical protein [Opitutaceae bacterium]
MPSPSADSPPNLRDRPAPAGETACTTPFSGHSLGKSTELLNESGQPAAAESSTRAAAEKTLRADPANIEALARHAASCAALDDWRAAESSWRRILSFRP